MQETATTPAEVYEAVERGMKWLDEHCPDWVQEIDLNLLDLASSEYCVLGQTAQCLLPKGYRSVYDSYGDEPIDPDFHDVVDHYDLCREEGSRGPANLGFDAMPMSYSAELDTHYEMLTIAWKEKIAERLALRDG